MAVRSTARRGWWVPAGAVLAAMLLPWIAVAVVTHQLPLVPSHPAAGAVGQGTVAVPAADDADLAAMYLLPSAGEGPAVSAPPGRLAAAGAPRRVVVPALGVDARVVPISGSSGTLLPPSDARTIGWWREGQVPGAARGSAVLTGHTVHTGGGAFDDLGRLRPPAGVLVRTDGGWIRYAVTSTTTYRKGRLAEQAATLFARSGPGRLVLVTCSHFDGREYRANTVVTAAPVSG